MKSLLKNIVCPSLVCAAFLLSGCTSSLGGISDYGVAEKIAERAAVKVVIHSDDGSSVSGGGVWLGNGEVLTAFHLFYQPPRVLKETDEILVLVGGQSLPAKIVFSGDLGDSDLALLKIARKSVPVRLAQQPAPNICKDVEPVGAQLYITAYDGIYPTTASPDGTVMYKGKRWSKSVTAIVSHGVSGSPVFDTETSCLAGIVSRASLVPSGDIVNDPKQLACEKNALLMNDGGLGMTCSVTAQTIFSTSDSITQFLFGAREYERVHAIE